jgi:hypothetical protein
MAGCLRLDHRPFAGGTFDGQGSAQHLDTLAHPEQTKRSSVMVRAGTKPTPSSSDGAHALIRQAEQHVDARGWAVERRVGQRFLDDAEQRRFNLDRRRLSCMPTASNSPRSRIGG